MKIKITLIAIVTIIVLSCDGTTGIPGPPGPPGAPGEDGINGILGQVFEVEAFFDKGDDYQYLVDIPSEIEVFESDIVMAYVLVGVDNDVDIWEPLPQTLFIGNEILLYGFDHTMFDVNFFMDGNIDLGSLGPEFTDGVIFRVAVIPADYAKNINVDKLEHVMSALKVEHVKRIN